MCVNNLAYVFTSLIEFTQARITSIRNLHMHIISVCHYELELLVLEMLLPFKYCPMNVLINLVEFQLKQKL